MGIFIFFLLGICVGSFLNVVIDRGAQGESILYGRSHCDFCKHILAWYDLIPVVSFLFLLGKCRYCHKKLSWQYPLIELTTGIMFALFFFWGNPVHSMQYISLFLDITIFCTGFSLAIMDIKYQLLLDKLVLTFGLLAVAKILLEDPIQLPFRLGIGLCSALPFFLIFFFSKGKAMGFGDVKLSLTMGIFLGFPNILIAYYIAFLTGGIVAIILILAGRKKLHGGTIALGPFLLFGTAAAALYGNTLWEFVKKFITF